MTEKKCGPAEKKSDAASLTLFWFFIGGIAPALLLAGPRIAVDTPIYDVGVVFDDKDRTFTHTFTVKNTGNAPLVISNIRKTCRCTAVEFDSVIPSGGTGHITETVSTDDASKGPFSMPITVISDARNIPILKLTVKGIFKWIIDVDPPGFNITTAKGSDSAINTLTLRSNMNGLKISGVSFSSIERNQGFSWRSSFPMNHSFSLVSDKTADRKKTSKRAPRNVGYAYTYELKITYPSTEQLSKTGDLIITTNHPEKPEIRITGAIVIY